MNILFSPNCDCEKGKPFADRSFPEYFNGKDTHKGYDRFLSLMDQEEKGIAPLYYAIHVNGSHILRILQKDKR